MTDVTIRARPAALGLCDVWLVGSRGQGQFGLQSSAATVLLEHVASVRLDASGVAVIPLTPLNQLLPTGLVYKVRVSPPLNLPPSVFHIAGFTAATANATDWITDPPAAVDPTGLALERAQRDAADVLLQAQIAALGGGIPAVITLTTSATGVYGRMYEADTTAGGFSVTLPVPASGQPAIRVKKIGTGVSPVTILPNGGLIDGLTSYILTVTRTSVDLVCDGINWQIT